MPLGGCSSATRLKVLPRGGQAFHSSYEKGHRGAVAAKPLGEPAPDSCVSTAPAQVSLRPPCRGTHGAKGQGWSKWWVCLWAPDLSSLTPRPQEGFSAPVLLLGRSRGQAGLPRQATLLSVASGVRSKTLGSGSFLLSVPGPEVKEERPWLKKPPPTPQRCRGGSRACRCS